MANLARNVTVGLLFLGSLVVLGIATLTVSSVSFLKDAYALPVRFANVDNLKEGDAVVIHGHRVGQVDEILYEPSVSPSTPILVRCSVDPSLRPQLNENATFTVRSSGPLGGRYLEILVPQPVETAPPPPDGFVGDAPGDLFQQLAELVRKNEANITSLLENFKLAVEEIKETFRGANEGEGTIGLLLRDEDTRQRAYNFIADASEAIARIRDDVTGDKGIVSYLLRDEKGKESLRSTIERLNEVITEIKEGKGILARLINDPELAARITEVADDFHDVIHKVNSGHGTLGQLVNNPKMWDEAIRVFVLARETIEDIREQAPVSTFVNAAFSAF